MHLVKLDAIDSTNTYLKDWSRRAALDNYTVVTAEFQSGGRGQMGSLWMSDRGKNLIMSILVRDFLTSSMVLFDLNIVISLAVIDTLKKWEVPHLKIKWPNDIMSADKKLGGILIENGFKSDGSVDSVIGIGLNVNQLQFDNLPQASSIAVVIGHEIDKELILGELVLQIKEKISLWEHNDHELRSIYTNLLFRKDELVLFQSRDGKSIKGSVKGVSDSGSLLIEDEEGMIQDFGLKDIRMIF